MEKPVLLVVGESPVLHQEADEKFGSSFKVLHARSEGEIIEQCVFGHEDIKVVLVDPFLEGDGQHSLGFSALPMIEPIRKQRPNIPVIGIYLAMSAHEQLLRDAGCTHCVSSVVDSFRIICDEVKFEE